MKTYLKKPLLVSALFAGITLMPAGRVTAQTFTRLHSFTAVTINPLTGDNMNSDGANPWAGLLLSGNTLYGATRYGGSSGAGAIIAVKTDGTGFTNLHSFTAVDANFPARANSEGAYPISKLILSGNTLYGTASGGGSADGDNFFGGGGTVFAVNTDGTGFTKLHNFGSGRDGYRPGAAGLILSGNTLYGTTSEGGTNGSGTVFAINTDGTGYTTLYAFNPFNGNNPSEGNSDGARPTGGLILSGNTLYGTASQGGNSNNGTVFAINTDGSDFTVLHKFSGFPSDGSMPIAGLILSGNTLYGTTQIGGTSWGRGTVFKLNTTGTGFTNMHSFDESHGVWPHAGLILSGNTLYGTTWSSGVFAINTDGMGFTNVYNFTTASGSPPVNSDGYNTYAGLVLSGNTLYGTAYAGGSAGSGTVFSLSLPPPPLAINSAGSNVILSWPTNAPTPPAGFTLQSTTNLAPAVWSSVSPVPIVVNGQNTVTNPISGPQMFFRLNQ